MKRIKERLSRRREVPKEVQNGTYMREAKKGRKNEKRERLSGDLPHPQPILSLTFGSLVIWHLCHASTNSYNSFDIGISFSRLQKTKQPKKIRGRKYSFPTYSTILWIPKSADLISVRFFLSGVNSTQARQNCAQA